jgi:hypothetical protein
MTTASGRVGVADQALAVPAEPVARLGPSGFDPSRIPWHFGCTDDTYGVRVWLARIENLRGHFRLIRDYLPEDADWLRGQVLCAIEYADQYIDDYSPTRALDRLIASGIEARSDATPQSGAAEGESPSDAQSDPAINAATGGQQ